MCNQDIEFEYRVVVVDYGCPDGVSNYLKNNPLPNLRIVSALENVDEFNISRARNIGVRHSDAEIITFIDADNLVERNWLRVQVMPIIQGECEYTYPYWLTYLNGSRVGKTYLGKGSVSITKSSFMKIRGYDESMTGWGWEDVDFADRAENSCKHQHCVGDPLLKIIDHSNELRFENYSTKDLFNNGYKNKKLAESRKTVNPNGFGLGEVEIYDVPWSWI